MKSEKTMTAAEIADLIRSRIPGASVTVEDPRGDGRHFHAIVAFAGFDGLSRIEQHKAVYAALGNDIGEAIHALQITTRTPAA